jgi:hypothetical protein
MDGSGSGGGKIFGRFTEQAFGFRAVGEATWRVTRRRWWRGARAVWAAVRRQASLAAGQRAGTCSGPPRGQA